MNHLLNCFHNCVSSIKTVFKDGYKITLIEKLDHGFGINARICKNNLFTKKMNTQIRMNIITFRIKINYLIIGMYF